jgi:hypothetical protein
LDSLSFNWILIHKYNYYMTWFYAWLYQSGQISNLENLPRDQQQQQPEETQHKPPEQTPRPPQQTRRHRPRLLSVAAALRLHHHGLLPAKQEVAVKI